MAPAAGRQAVLALQARDSLLPGVTHPHRQSSCLSQAGPALENGALAGKRHAGRIESRQKAY